MVTAATQTMQRRIVKGIVKKYDQPSPPQIHKLVMQLKNAGMESVKIRATKARTVMAFQITFHRKCLSLSGIFILQKFFHSPVENIGDGGSRSLIISKQASFTEKVLFLDKV